MDLASDPDIMPIPRCAFKRQPVIIERVLTDKVMYSIIQSNSKSVRDLAQIHQTMYVIQPNFSEFAYASTNLGKPPRPQSCESWYSPGHAVGHPTRPNIHRMLLRLVGIRHSLRQQ